MAYRTQIVTAIPERAVSMKTVYLSESAYPELKTMLSECGYEVRIILKSDALYSQVSDHPDMYMCKLGVRPEDEILMAEPEELGHDYPQDIAFNAVCLDKYFIHNLKHTSARLLDAVEKCGKTLINVSQGYTKCSTVVVDGSSVITEDNGIYRILSEYADISVLKIDAGYVELPGFDYGFIGGASGKVGDTVVFNGDLSKHPQFERVKGFIEDRGLNLKWIAGKKLWDIGSIIEFDDGE